MGKLPLKNGSSGSPKVSKKRRRSSLTEPAATTVKLSEPTLKVSPQVKAKRKRSVGPLLQIQQRLTVTHKKVDR